MVFFICFFQRYWEDVGPSPAPKRWKLQRLFPRSVKAMVADCVVSCVAHLDGNVSTSRTTNDQQNATHLKQKKHSNHLRISSFHSIQIHFCIFISFYSHSLFRIHFSRFRMEQKETKLRRSIQNHGESQRGLESTSNYHGNDGDDDHCHQLFVPWYYKVPQSLLSPKVRIP